eukprot:TRINITY_DN7822_c0_g1_i2.p1 TRINITY_DN7822_c0_g1~~TRINITY_DN7822_c0_g1_i2.p1  ORF type:complete len:134 (-),score=8.26 TRINITY_DN7822_c0_g1_i2:71-418(-)
MELCRYLSESGSGRSVKQDLWPQLVTVIRETLAAVQYIFEPTSEYVNFQFFGYDFMLDEDFNLWLLEINATPASAEYLLNQMVADFIQVAVDEIFPPPVPKCRESGNQNKFVLIT